MWKVVYIAQTAEAAARIKEVLAANGFLTQTKTTNSKHGGVYEISVPLSEAEDAYESFAKTSFSCNSKEAGQ